MEMAYSDFTDVSSHITLTGSIIVTFRKTAYRNTKQLSLEFMYIGSGYKEGEEDQQH